MRLFKTGEKRGKGRIKKFIALMIAGTMLAGSVSYAAGTKGLSSYLNIMKTDKLVKDSKTKLKYTNQSGFCADNDGYFYIARINNDTKRVKICKSDKNDKKKWTNIYEGLDVGHANDMTYYDGKLYICSKGGNNTTGPVIKVFDIAGKKFIKSYKDTDLKSIDGKEFNCSPSGIAYDKDRKVFYLTQKKKDKFIVSVFDLKGKSVESKNGGKSVVLLDFNITEYKNYLPQGITYKDNVLYVSFWDANGTVDGVNYGGQNNSIVVPYMIKSDNDLNNFTFATYPDNNLRLDQDTKKNMKFEIEGISFVGKKLYMAVNADGSKKGDDQGDAIYYYDSSEYFAKLKQNYNKFISDINHQSSADNLWVVAYPF